jgi:hypothetical protein
MEPSALEPPDGTPNGTPNGKPGGTPDGRSNGTPDKTLEETPDGINKLYCNKSGNNSSNK